MKHALGMLDNHFEKENIDYKDVVKASDEILDFQ
jgi:hypothetical protein